MFIPRNYGIDLCANKHRADAIVSTGTMYYSEWVLSRIKETGGTVLLIF